MKKPICLKDRFFSLLFYKQIVEFLCQKSGLLLAAGHKPEVKDIVYAPSKKRGFVHIVVFFVCVQEHAFEFFFDQIELIGFAKQMAEIQMIVHMRKEF